MNSSTRQPRQHQWMWTGLCAAAMVVVAGAIGVRAQTPGVAAPPPGPSDAPALVADAIKAMGGEDVLMGVKALSLEIMGHQWALEQSERPEGPWLSLYQQRTEIRDLTNRRGTIRTQRRDWNFPQWSPATTTVIADGVAARTNGQRWGGGLASDVDGFAATLDLSPERLLFTVRNATDLRRLPDEVQHGVLQRVLGFSYGGVRCRLLLNAWTSLPTMLETVRDDRFAIWGDVTERRWFTFWTLEAGGLKYPRQTTTEWNGYPYADETVQGLTINPALDTAAFEIPAEARAAFAANRERLTGMASQEVDESRLVAINDWVTQVPGGFNVAFVKQPDGLVVIEATTVSSYSAQILALAEKRYPGVPVKAVVTTSDAWPHLGGVREYVARGIPVYALDLNVPIVSRVIEAPRTIAPDRLAASWRAPEMTAVSTRTVIGTGETRIELIPVRGEFGERMMLAWLPGARLLYSSDLIQPGRPGTNTFFMPEMLTEVVAAVTREGMTDIDRVFGMHLPPTPWANVLAAIAEAVKR